MSSQEELEPVAPAQEEMEVVPSLEDLEPAAPESEGEQPEPASSMEELQPGATMQENVQPEVSPREGVAASSTTAGGVQIEAAQVQEDVASRRLPTEAPRPDDSGKTVASSAPVPVKAAPGRVGRQTSGTRSAPPNPNGAIRQGAYKASIDLPPKWTMRGKTSFGSPFKSAKQADEGGMAGDMSSKYNEIGQEPPRGL